MGSGDDPRDAGHPDRTGKSSGTDPPEARAAGRPPCAPRRALWTVVKVIELRLRFIVLMLGTGLVFGYWDTLANRFEKWRRPPGRIHEVAGRVEYFCPMHPSVIVATPAQCPICGMPLARRARGAATATPEGALSQVRLTPGRSRRRA